MVSTSLKPAPSKWAMRRDDAGPDRRGALLPAYFRLALRWRRFGARSGRRRQQSHRSSGALEIPAAIALAADHYDGFIALGCVIRGETYHFEIVANESARGLMELSVHRGLCIGNGILTVENEEQALGRARRDESDKGGDAARACLALIALRNHFGSL